MQHAQKIGNDSEKYVNQGQFQKVYFHKHEGIIVYQSLRSLIMKKGKENSSKDLYHDFVKEYGDDNKDIITYMANTKR